MSDTKHTPAPWCVEHWADIETAVDCGQFLWTEGEWDAETQGRPSTVWRGSREAGSTGLPGSVEVGEHNARRIVACVNALEGVPDLDLAALAPGELRDILAAAKAPGAEPLAGSCVWCGKRFEGFGDPFAAARAHFADCPDHPVRAVERQRDGLLAACRDLLGHGLVAHKDPDTMAIIARIRATVETPR